MGQAIPNQHPAVVLRSHFNALRALLAVALIVVAGLTVAVVILATDDEQVADTTPAAVQTGSRAAGSQPTVSAPDESRTAAAIGADGDASTAKSDPIGPDESKTAAAIGSDTDASTAVDESAVAAEVCCH
jgi:hypothetical protein